MTPLSDAQKQLLFDYSVGQTSERETVEAEDLLFKNEEAAQLFEVLRAALAPLDSVELEPCPDELAERTILRLKELARATGGRTQLEQLLYAEHARTIPLRIPFWRNWGDIAAVAAALVLFMSVLFPALGLARQRHWQSRCQSQFADIYGGLTNYISDHDGQFPTVATAQGTPWWMVGAQGPENLSNTRRAWLLVKHVYVPTSAFLCPARRDAGRPDTRTLPVANYDDFPARSYIHFSVRIDCPRSSSAGLIHKRVFLADLNPLSEEFPRDISASPSIELCDKLLKANSGNHRQRGQNILFCDGSVEFSKTRRVSFSDDDIYTVQTMSCGQKVRGDERPSSEADTFVAP